MNNPIYTQVCYASQVIGRPNPTFREITEVLTRFYEVAHRPFPPLDEIKRAFREFNKASAPINPAWIGRTGRFV